MTLSRSLRLRLAVPVLAAVTVLGSMAGCATAISGVAAPVAGAAPVATATVTTAASTTATATATGGTAPDPSSGPTPTDQTVAPTGSDTGTADTGTADTGTAGTAAPSVAGEPVDPVAFAELVQEGTSGITSMTFALTTKAATRTIKISGVETVEKGRVTAASMKIGGAMSLEFLLISGKVYLGGDASVLKALGVDDPKTRWVVAKKNSSNTTLATIAEQLESSLAQTGPESFVSMVSALKSVTRTGAQTVDGVAGTGYVVVIDVSKLAGSSGMSKQSSAALKAAGITELTMPIQLDEKNRIRQFTQKFEVAGQQVSNEFVVSEYDTPVTIKAPDPATVSEGN